MSSAFSNAFFSKVQFIWFYFWFQSHFHDHYQQVVIHGDDAKFSLVKYILEVVYRNSSADGELLHIVIELGLLIL